MFNIGPKAAMLLPIFKKHEVNVGQERFDFLFEKYSNNSLTPVEFQEFVALLDSTESERDIEMVAQRDWMPSKELLKSLAKEEKARRHTRIRRIIVSVAASIAVLLSSYLFWPEAVSDSMQVSYSTEYGETKSVQLSDGSTVLLNANSTLLWDLNWKKAGKRSAHLEGEAFFEVEKMQDVKFNLTTGDIMIKVLGTSFNVRSRNGNTDVFLNTGVVDLAIENRAEENFSMSPGDLIHYRKAEQLVVNESSTMGESASWVDGMLEFQNQSLGEILLRFEELYGKKFQVEKDDVFERRMDLSLPYSNWDLIKRALELSLQVEFTEVQDTIFVN